MEFDYSDGIAARRLASARMQLKVLFQNAS
jgi:hypothetical protein